jgi:hypothetical protein
LTGLLGSPRQAPVLALGSHCARSELQPAHKVVDWPHAMGNQLIANITMVVLQNIVNGA